MNEKLPYYMAYPMPFSYEDEKTERTDAEYLRSLYPELPKRLLPYVEEECDRLEYENSMIYDQYPDKLQLKLMCRRAYENVLRHERIPAAEQEGRGGRAAEREGRGGRPAEEMHLRDLIEVMLYQELYKRRCSHRRRNRRFY